ncbi:MAG: DUF5674 family protein [Candidatus Margulisbacteria bacterium]|nr:DUF5674 family protein [Candidatus Margulisiibacteriota bacterium]
MKIVNDKIALAELKQMAQSKFGNFVKAVIDVERKLMIIDAELHADEEALLIEQGSKQADLWGINIYPELGKDEWIEFDSMINLRPSQGNRTRGVDNPDIRGKIIQVVNNLIKT